jgi:SRSO17 transposase
MSLPIMCLDGQLRQYLEYFLVCFNGPQWRHFVTVLLGLMQVEGRSTLSGLVRRVVEASSVSSLSRFLSAAPWSAWTVAERWQRRFRERLMPLVEAEHARQASQQPRRRGHPKATAVTGYLIGDDSTQHKVRGDKMGGLGQHYSSSEDKPVNGHSLVQGLYVLLGQRCPLAPSLYQQESVCERAEMTFRSKIHLMRELIRTFEPVPHTVTHVLLDTWYTCKHVWRLTRERGFLITSGLKANRWLRVEDAQSPKGWSWQRLSDYAAHLPPTAYQAVVWPNGEHRTVFVHVIATRVRKLYRCQVVIIRPTLDCPAKAIRYWASSDMDADLLALVAHIAMRWEIEVFFEDVKDVLGLDHYQLMTTTAILRFWTLVMAAYVFLDEQRTALEARQQKRITIGQARQAIRRTHYCRLIDWLHDQFLQGATPSVLYDILVA